MNTLVSNDSTHEMVTYDLVVNGEAVDSSYQVTSISVTKEVNRIPTAKITLRDGDAAEGQFELSNTASFIPGNEIVVKIGRDRDNSVVFEGIIVRHRVLVREAGASSLVIECKDEAVKMTVGRHNRYFEDSLDSEIMEALIGEYSGLTPDVKPTLLQHAETGSTSLYRLGFACITRRG